MAAPFGNILSKTARAVCAQIIAAGAGTQDDTNPEFDSGGKSYPNTTVTCGIARPDPHYSGNYRIPVQVSVKGSKTQESDEPNDMLSRVAFDQRCAQVSDSLMQSNDGQTLDATAELITQNARAWAVDDSGGADTDEALFAQNNADMADFTCLMWIDNGFGEGVADEEGCAWEMVFLFEALVCPSNVD